MSVPLLCLHGWGMRADVWAPLSEALNNTLAPALPGYTDAADPATIAAAVDMLADAAPKEVDLAGWSLGGMLALHWAATRPQQVRKLVLIASTPCFLRKPDWPHGVDGGMLRIFAMQLRLSPGALIERFCALQAAGDAAGQVLTDRLMALRAPASAGALQSSLGMLEEDLRPTATAISKPMLLLHGEADAVVPIAAARWLEAQCTGARLHAFTDTGHAPLLSRSAECAALIRSFRDE